MKKILFVDDEAHALEALRHTLHTMHSEWKMEFAQSGEEALRTLSGQPFDVVVSDLRMPGMDGAALLAEVRRRHPQIMRIILSDRSGQETILKTAGLSHQCIAKPCEAEKLKQTIRRACALRDLLASRSLQQLVSQMESLPSLPTLYAEMCEELQSPSSSVKRLGEIVARDLGMTAKILQLVNSAFFGLRRHLSNPIDAVSFLGSETVMSLALSVHVFSQFNQAHLPNFSLETLWHHSMATGTLAKRIATSERASAKSAGDTFTAGLLHDVGKVILATTLPDWYKQAISVAEKEKITIAKAEREIFGATHAEVGAYLLGLWGLPDEVLEAVAFHHDPTRFPTQGFSTLTAVHVANVLEHESHAAQQKAETSAFDHQYLSQLGLTQRLQVWRELKQSLNN